jgi:hypothetical protein
LWRGCSKLLTIDNRAAGDTPLPAALAVEELAACFVVRNHNGQQLAYV